MPAIDAQAPLPPAGRTGDADVPAPSAGASCADPMPEAPPEPQLEDCCGSGCVVCVFDAYELARARHAARLLAWQQRHGLAPAG